MMFWDSSALVPLCLSQPSTPEVRRAIDGDSELVVWWGSTIECASAIARLHRDGQLTAAEEGSARSVLRELSRSWFEVQPGDGIRDQALRLVRLHPLRAADALQLSAALEWSGTPVTGAFLTFDDRLRSAAHREGFSTP